MKIIRIAKIVKNARLPINNKKEKNRKQKTKSKKSIFYFIICFRFQF